MNKIFIVLTCFIMMFAPSVSANEMYSEKDLAKIGIIAVLLHAVWEKLADEMINYGGFPYYELYCGAKNCTLSA